MAKLDLALVVRTVDQATRPLRNIQRTVNQVGRQTGLDRVGRGLQVTGRQMRVVSAEALTLAGNLGGIAVAVGGLVGGAALRAFGSIEQLEIAFTSFLKSEEKAIEMVKQLTDFTAKTPFQLQDVGASGKMLMSFGVAAGDVIDRLQLLGDIASGANVPLNEMAAIYGKTLSKGKAQTEELNQMSERGVPIIQALVDLHKDLGYTISKQDVYDAASQSKITAQNIEDAMRRMTGASGLFYNQMKLQSESLFGLLSTLRDNVFLVLADTGEQIERTFGVKEGMRKFIAWLGGLTAELKKPADAQTGAAREITQTIEDVVAVVGWLRAGLGKLADKIGETGLDGLAKDFGIVRLAVIGVTGFLSLGLLSAIIGLFTPLASLAAALGFVLLANPVLAAIAAIAIAARLLYIYWDEVVAYMKGTWAEIKEMFSGENVLGFLKGLPNFLTDPFGFSQEAAAAVVGAGGLSPGLSGPAGSNVNVGGEIRELFAGVNSFLKGLPNFLTDPFGFSQEAAAAVVGAGGLSPGLSGPAGSNVNVGGEVRVRFDGLPRGATVDVSSDNPAVPLDVESGYILGPI